MGIGQSISGGLSYKGTKKAIESQEKAAKDLTARMELAKADVLARRPQAQQERQVALSRQLGLLQPANSLVSEMGGGRYGLNLGPELAQSPVSMKPLASQAVPEGASAADRARHTRALQQQGYDLTGFSAGGASRKPRGK